MELYVITCSSLFLTALVSNTFLINITLMKLHLLHLFKTFFQIILFQYAQKIQYVSRFRNFSVESETGDMYLINCTIYQKNLDHALAGVVNVTNDILVKKVCFLNFITTLQIFIQ